jgi:hypothetical protein
MTEGVSLCLSDKIMFLFLHYLFLHKWAFVSGFYPVIRGLVSPKFAPSGANYNDSKAWEISQPEHVLRDEDVVEKSGKGRWEVEKEKRERGKVKESEMVQRKGGQERVYWKG